MKDFPVFVTEHGAASLTISQVPYTGCAYIRIQDSEQPQLLLQDCIDFCNAVGAAHIYATGHPVCEEYPVYTNIIQMQNSKENLSQANAALFPVTDKTLDTWLEIYNRKAKNMPTGVWMTQSDGLQMLQQGSGYFVHKNGELLGIGKVVDDELQWIASVCSGAGREVVQTLSQISGGDLVTVTVATENKKAMKLYEDMGFLPVCLISCWHTIK